jgi:biotin carboxyl carrier protein
MPCLLSRSERRPIEVPAVIPRSGIKFRLQGRLPQAICRDNKQAVREGNSPDGPSESGMPEIRIMTEVAGRVCVLPVEAGCSVAEGDDIAFVEAMKMEIPVASPAAGTLKSLLVKIDDVVAEGQAIAIVET